MSYNYPTINYIGNKQKITDWIISKIPISDGVVADVFSGGASVSYAFKKAGFQVYSNDFLYSNYVLAKAIIENKGDILDLRKIDLQVADNLINKKKKEISFLSNNVYFDFEVEELAKLCLVSERIKEYEKSMFLALLRRAMIRKIPYSRMNIKWEEIQKFRDEEYSYMKYKRRRAYHNKSFMYHIEDYIDQYNRAIFDNGRENRAYQKDAFDFIESLKENVDIIYIDPPYPSTMNNYKSFYGYFDKMLNNEVKEFKDFTMKSQFINVFNELLLISSKKSKYLIVSLNNRTVPSYLEILILMESFGNVDVYKKEHAYKVTGKKNKKKNQEILLVLEVEKKNKQSM